MPRLIVTTDDGDREKFVHEEAVYPVILDNSHAAAQVIERVAVAVIDAEEAEERYREQPVGLDPPRGEALAGSASRAALRSSTDW
jgi:hypothetical protein